MLTIDKSNKYSVFEDGELEDIDRLLATILPTQKEDIPYFLADFLDACLANRGLSLEGFAERLGVEPEFVNVLLSGTLPESELTDDLIERIAGALEHNTDNLRFVLGLDVNPAIESDGTTQKGQIATQVDAPPLDEDLTEEAFLHLKGEMEAFLGLWDEVYKSDTRANLEIVKDAMLKSLKGIVERLEGIQTTRSTDKWKLNPTHDQINRLVQSVRNINT